MIEHIARAIQFILSVFIKHKNNNIQKKSMFEKHFLSTITMIVLAFGINTIYKVYPFDKFLAFVIYIGASILAYFLTLFMIPKIKELNLKADMFGMDINKKGINWIFKLLRNSWRFDKNT